jgi:transaldolase/glucose-6-phosphate isomerase
MNSLQQLREAGQGVWLDFLRRGLISGGELGRMITECALSGVTSNPSIFRKAIGGSTDYDDAIRELAEEGIKDPVEAFYRLALADIQMAAGVLAGVYESTHGGDGYVSFELEPALAHDTGRSRAMAGQLYDRLGRKNVMIKVPGTPAGVSVVEDLTAAGVNVNITLLFSLSSYEAVARAYIRGLKRRLEAGRDVDKVASVASFFVSRVDSTVDALLPKDSDLRGKVAIANAKVAYKRFRELFSGPAWAPLAAAGAKVQRPLWASTGTKNPAYSDVMYVEELVGPDTVNTMPQATMDAFLDHGVVRPEAVCEHLEEAQAILAALSGLGIDIEAVGKQLQEDGINSFAQDFDALTATVKENLEKVGPIKPRWQSSLAGVAEPTEGVLARLGERNIVKRMWRRDYTVWKPDPTEILDRLGWLVLPETMPDRAPELVQFAKQARADGFEKTVLLGMGGSSLAPEVFRYCFGATPDGMDLVVLDSTHPGTIASVRESLELDHTLFLVASKSGTTIETLSHFKYFFDLVPDPEHFVAITDPGSYLDALGTSKGFRQVFLNPVDIGGRYSALSLFGLVPAALLGLNLDTLLDRAEETAYACHHYVPGEENPGAWLGAVIGAGAAQGMDKVTLLADPRVAAFGNWVEQLIAESTGKEGKGIIPIVGEDLGSPASYGDDRLFVSVGEVPGIGALEEAGHPVVRLPLKDPYDLGSEFFRWEFATAVAGWVLGINPFDQPNVAQAKQATSRILESGPAKISTDPLEDVLASIRPGNYMAIQAYVDRNPETREALQQARLAIRDRYKVATTLGFGPRFLHSTGQLHKGGPNSGVFIQVMDAVKPEDIPIPGARYTFGELIEAQALGDLDSLKAGKRRVARVTLEQLKEVVG